MNSFIENRITPSLTALRSSLTTEDVLAGQKLARQWLSSPGSKLPGYVYLAAALLRAKNVERSFPPLTDGRRLANGHRPHAGLILAAEELCSALTRNDEQIAALPDSLKDFLKKASALVAIAALESDFEAALAQGNTRWAKTHLYTAMHKCPQGPKETTAGHCLSVAQQYRALATRLIHPAWAEKAYVNRTQHLPKWFETWKTQLASAIENHGGLARTYLEWHDCGKPFCLEYDAQGRAHFPDHAKRSAQLWERVGGSPEVAQLMEQDMDLHTLPPSAMPEFAQRKHAALLLVAALAAVNANAKMFGGFESDSFKIKAKQLEARGKRLCAALFDEVNIKAVA